MPRPQKLILIFILCFTGTGLCVKKTAGQGIFDYLYYGAKAGTNYTWFDNSQPHTSGKTGYSAGFTVEMRRYRRIFIVSGIHYVREGGRYLRIVDQGFNYLQSYVASNNISLHNLEVPLMARIFLRDGKQFLPYIFAGPSISMNVKVTNDFERTMHLTESKLTYSGLTDISNQFRQWGGCFNLGIGSEVLIANQSILFEVNYRYGISPVSTAFSFIGNGNIVNSLFIDGIQLNIAYNF